MTHGNVSPRIAQCRRWDDPRIECTKLHRRQGLIVMSVCAVICGAAHGVEVAACCDAQQEWWAQGRDLPQGIPSPDTCGGVCARLDTQAFADCFLQWVQEAEPGPSDSHRAPARAPLGRGRVRRPQPYWPPPANIGTLETQYTGPWMSASRRATAASAGATGPRTWRALRVSGAGLPSICRTPKPKPGPVSLQNANVPAGTWIVSTKSWPNKIDLARRVSFQPGIGTRGGAERCRTLGHEQCGWPLK